MRKNVVKVVGATSSGGFSSLKGAQSQVKRPCSCYYYKATHMPFSALLYIQHSAARCVEFPAI